MRKPPTSPLVRSLLAACVAGCAHTGQNQYSYAPPLAPPVYPQPQTPVPPAAAPVTTVPAPVAVPGAIAPGAAFGGVPMAGQPMVVTQAAITDPCCMPMDGGAMPVVHEMPGQTPPCPPGP